MNTQKCFYLTAHTEPHSSPHPISGSGSSMSKAHSAGLRAPSIFCTPLYPQTQRLDSAQPVLVGVLAVLFLPLGFSSPCHRVTPALPAPSHPSIQPTLPGRLTLRIVPWLSVEGPFPVVAWSWLAPVCSSHILLSRPGEAPLSQLTALWAFFCSSLSPGPSFSQHLTVLFSGPFFPTS